MAMAMASWELTEGIQGGGNQGNYAPTTDIILVLWYMHALVYS